MFQAPELFSGEEVRGALRRDAGNVLLSAILMAAGCPSLAVFRIRKKPADRALLWFGLLTGLYGLRLLLQSSDTFQFAAQPIPIELWGYLIAAITYSITLLGTLFLHDVFPAWAIGTPWS